MPEGFFIDKNNTAVLILDYQNDIAALIPEERRKPLLQKAASVLHNARKAGLPIIYAANIFREGYPEISPRNKIFSGVKAKGMVQPGRPGAEINAEVAPQKGEILVAKHRSSALHDTDLETILKVKGITKLVIMGISTGGCVLSTVRRAADLDYDIVVVSDGCADPDEEMHDVLVRKIFPRQAAVVTAQEFIAAIK